LVSAELKNAFAEIAALTAQLDSAELSDTLTLDQWIDQRVSDPAQRKLFEMVVGEEVGRELREISLLAYVTIYRSSVERLGDDYIVAGGTRRVIEALACELQSFIRCGAPVSEIRQSEQGVTVTVGGEKFSAETVILTIPPPTINTITFDPPLPAAKRNLYTNMRMGNIIKCIVTYPKPFWYEQGLSGSILSDEGILECVLDANFQTACGALIGYMIGDTAATWSQRTQAERRAAVVAQLVDFLGESAREPLEYVDINWLQTPFIGGAYYGSTAPGALGCGNVLGERFGRIHFAGTETSKQWVGTLEGAVRSGERAANEIVTDGKNWG
jgi:monoamine oxidase